MKIKSPSTAERLLSLLTDVIRVDKNRWKARCPAHRDVNPSLSITETHDRVLIHCFTGCKVQDIVDKLGLQMSDLFRDRQRPVTAQELRRRRAVDRLEAWLEEEIKEVARGLRERDRLVRYTELALKRGRLTEAQAWDQLGRAYFGYSELEYKFERLLREDALTLWRAYGKTSD
jgi:hypothetical protein